MIADDAFAGLGAKSAARQAGHCPTAARREIANQTLATGATLGLKRNSSHGPRSIMTWTVPWREAPAAGTHCQAAPSQVNRPAAPVRRRSKNQPNAAVVATTHTTAKRLSQVLAALQDSAHASKLTACREEFENNPRRFLVGEKLVLLIFPHF